MSESFRVSVAINTYNEEKNIANAIESVPFADEIIIVDMYSSDRTVEIAKRYSNVKVFNFEPCGYADPARQYAIEQVSNDWVMVLDADELVTPVLWNELKSVVENDLADVVQIPRVNYMFGEKIICGGWAKDTVLRFFKKSSIIGYSARVHSDFYQFPTDVRKIFLDIPEAYILHFNYLGIEHFIEKMNKYTTIEAAEMFKGQRGIPKAKHIIKDCLWFIPRFMWKSGGRKNGWTGLALAVLMLTYKISTFAKYKLMTKYSSSLYQDEIYKEYQVIASKVINGYKAKE